MHIQDGVARLAGTGSENRYFRQWRMRPEFESPPTSDPCLWRATAEAHRHRLRGKEFIVLWDSWHAWRG